MSTGESNPVDWEWLAGEVRSAAASFVAQLRIVAETVLGGATPVPNLDWDVAELTAHVTSLPSVYRAQNQLAGSFVPPDSWPEFSRESRAHITSSDLAVLSDELLREVNGLLDELGSDPTGSWTLYGQETTAANLAAGMLSELTLHGMDLAAITGATVTLTQDQAVAIVPAMMALVPAFLDPVRILRCVGVYHIRFRGGPEYTYRVAESGEMVIEAGKPERADCHLIADPAAFVLLGLGRMSQVKAALTGKVIAYGRKPWLLARLEAARVEGV